ncbi:uncharacterized protein LOC131673401 isoform X2 [Phymastichus coffea]|uniref:uncharacterized protein LOC131673401 isoform X2 n=1 Tax=Phymastichus coffea TaxID=108790 RepID=UPI00273BB4F1|nr:uncharacterized protein LOC131673401 isoform X2 [Phymastichus coffea]
MIITPLIFLLVLLVSNTQSLRRDSTIVYSDNEAPETRESHSVLSDMATELIRGSSGSSQILNINLSNLLLLLVLKAIVYSAGYIGNHTFIGRGEPPDNKILSGGEAALALGYFIGDTCLYRAACEVPQIAKGYLGAADVVFQLMKFMPLSLQTGDSYKNIMQEFQRAIELGFQNQCPSHYYCKKENIHTFLRP